MEREHRNILTAYKAYYRERRGYRGTVGTGNGIGEIPAPERREIREMAYAQADDDAATERAYGESYERALAAQPSDPF